MQVKHQTKHTPCKRLDLEEYHAARLNIQVWVSVVGGAGRWGRGRHTKGRENGRLRAAHEANLVAAHQIKLVNDLRLGGFVSGEGGVGVGARLGIYSDAAHLDESAGQLRSLAHIGRHESDTRRIDRRHERGERIAVAGSEAAAHARHVVADVAHWWWGWRWRRRGWAGRWAT